MEEYENRVRRVLLLALALNLAVALAKLVAGLRADSLAVIGDAAHSGIDALANVALLLVVRWSARPADEDHPFGHHKYETVAAFVLGSLLVVTSFELARAAVGRLLDPRVPDVSVLTLAVVGGTLLVNAGVAWYEGRKARELHSHALLADAAQTRGDIYVSAGVLVGLFFARAGVAAADGAIALAVAGFIAWSAWRVLQHVVPVLTDRVVYDAGEVARVVEGVPGVRSVHDIRSRGTPRDSFVQMHLVVDAEDVAGAHAIADEVERRLAARMGVREAVIHIEPEDDGSGPPGTAGKGPAGGRAARE